MTRLTIAALAAVTVLAGCSPAGDGAEAAAAGDTDTTRQSQATITHLVLRPDSVAAASRVCLDVDRGSRQLRHRLVSEIDTTVWQTSGIGVAEVAWPEGLEVPAGTYLWMVEGFRDGRRTAESGRAAFVVER